MSATITENTENNAQRPVRVRHCSYCKNTGHTIRTCNSNRLNIFEHDMFYNLYKFIEEHRRGNTTINLRDRFESWLVREYSNDKETLIAYAVKKYKVLAIANIRTIINTYLVQLHDYLELNNEIPNNYRIPVSQVNYSLENNTNNTTNNFETTMNTLFEQNQRTYDRISHQIQSEQMFLQETARRREQNFRDSVDLLLNNGFSANLNVLRAALIISLIDSMRENINQEKPTINIDIIHNENTNENCECNICYETYEKTNFVKLNCEHEFCKECVKNTIKSSKPCCAFCREDMKSFKVNSEDIKNEFNDLINH